MWIPKWYVSSDHSNKWQKWSYVVSFTTIYVLHGHLNDICKQWSFGQAVVHHNPTTLGIGIHLKNDIFDILCHYLYPPLWPSDPSQYSRALGRQLLYNQDGGFEPDDLYSGTINGSTFEDISLGEGSRTMGPSHLFTTL